MPRIDSEQFYKSAIALHGATAKGLNWTSLEKQLLRFDAILELLPKDLRNFTLADAGCGFGDFYQFLKEKNSLPKEYLGIDSLLDMCSIALERTPAQIILADICKDELAVKDYYICSGALSILTPFETYQFIHNCYKSSKKGFIFNTLFGDKESKTYNYMRLKTIKSIAKELGVREFILKDGYIKENVTIAFLK